MDRLWAPWRMKYIQRDVGKAQKGCIFCQAEQTRDDQKWFVVGRRKTCYTMLNTYPYNNGHLMVAPIRHTASFESLSPQELLEINASVAESIILLKKTIKPQGFNIGMNLGSISGAGIAQHLHMHIVPRWKGDSNFMPLIAQTKVISQSLEELYRLLIKSRSKN